MSMTQNEFDNLKIGDVIYYGGNYFLITNKDDVYCKIMGLDNPLGLEVRITNYMLLNDFIKLINKIPKKIQQVINIYNQYQIEKPVDTYFFEYINRYYNTITEGLLHNKNSINHKIVNK